MRLATLASVIPLASLIAPAALALEINSAQSGFWDQDNLSTWEGGVYPYTGTLDSITIGKNPDGSPHIILYTGVSGVGLTVNGTEGPVESKDLGVGGYQTITIDGGILAQTNTGSWARIGHATPGTLDIKDGAYYFTDATTGGGPHLVLGIYGGQGFVNIGDGTGAAGSAVLNLRDRIDGSANSATVEMDLGYLDNQENYGRIVINSDGVLEGDTGGIIRIGQGVNVNGEQSSIFINGGTFNARGTVEVAVNASGLLKAKGLIHIKGTTASMVQDAGNLVLGWNGDATMVIEDGGLYNKTGGGDIFIGREATSVSTVVVQSGGTFLRGAGDLRIGWRGTGTMVINNGGTVLSNVTNWEWVGQEAGSNGQLIINTGGAYESTNTSYLQVGAVAGATGTVLVDGGLFRHSYWARFGEGGNGTFRQISGESYFGGIILGANEGQGLFHLLDGTVNISGSFYLGGWGIEAVGGGSGVVNQDGGQIYHGGAFVVGLGGEHTGTYNMNNGTYYHTGGAGADVSIGESGTGVMTIAAGAEFHESSGGMFFVGRNDGSRGELYVNGLLTRSDMMNPIRVGNGNRNGTDNTDGVGVLGGTGTISSMAGVRIGAHGIITGGTLDTVGTLSIDGDLDIWAGGTVFANFDEMGGVDRLEVNGQVYLSGAILDGKWTGGLTSESDVYWLIVNDGVDPIFGEFANAYPFSSEDVNFAVAPNAFVTIDGQEFALFYGADSETGGLEGGNDVAMLAVIPEPSSIALLFGAMAVTLGRRRRKQA